MTEMFEFLLPDLGEGVAEGEVTQWFVSPGDRVARDEPLVEVLTDKAQVEIPSPVAGEVVSLNAEPGEVVPVGSVLVVIAPDGAGAAGGDAADRQRPADEEPAPASGSGSGETASPAATEQRPRPGAGGSDRGVQALPAVRRLAETLGVDLAAVTGTGARGAITEEDVRAAAGAGGGTPEVEPSVAEGEPLTGTRRMVAEHLTRAAEVPTVTNVSDADLTAVREAGAPPTAMTAWACVRALAEHPELNAWYDGERLVRHERIDLGIATQTDQGLVVPVIRGAEAMDLGELTAQIEEVTGAARERRASPEMLRGSTFTVTSAGRLAGLFATPLLNVPEVAILGLYRIEPRPVVRDGEVVVREMANLSITFDHRVLDGHDAARFLARVIELLETGP